MSANEMTAIANREQARFHNNLMRIIACAKVAYDRHRTRRALEALDDHMLKDIGISRSEIPLAAGFGGPSFITGPRAG